MNSGNQLAVLALGAVFWLPGFGAIWKASTLRGDVFNNLSDRVDIAKAGLSERSVKLLREIQSKTDELLGGKGERFDPDRVLADPAPLTDLTSDFEKTIKTRDRLDRRFEILLRLCEFIIVPACAYVLGVFGISLTVAKILNDAWLRYASFGLTAVTVVLAIVFVLVYYYLNSRITSAEMLGKTGHVGTDEG